ncbi:MAG: hypothetical protein QFX33_02525 [Candidatus Nezhaarchaeota archaeon]|nr:hypothetical protein [Candidatus Nezhaarchaeota archaeon]
MSFMLAAIAVSAVALRGVSSSVYVYYPETQDVAFLPPPIVFSHPPSVGGGYDVDLADRLALVFTDFEAYPLPGWSSRGGSWSLDSGYKGYGLRGYDTNRGGIRGEASHYYLTAPISGYTRYYVAVKVKLVDGAGDCGISLLNSAANNFYEASVSASSMFISRFDHPETFTLLNSTSVSLAVGKWYILLLEYVRAEGHNTFTLKVYDSSGTELKTLRASDSKFQPYYAGVLVDEETVIFDDFAFSMGDPRVIRVIGAPSGASFSVYDDLGTLVASSAAEGGVAELPVLTDIVVGRGWNGRLYSPELSINRTFSSIIGGDLYEVYGTAYDRLNIVCGPRMCSANITVDLSGLAGTYDCNVLNISVADGYTYYASLMLAYLEGSPSLNLSIASSLGSELQPLRIVDGSVIPDEVSEVEVAGVGSYIRLRCPPTTSGTVYLYLVYRAAYGPAGVVVAYPIMLMLQR